MDNLEVLDLVCRSLRLASKLHERVPAPLCRKLAKEFGLGPERIESVTLDSDGDDGSLCLTIVEDGKRRDWLVSSNDLKDVTDEAVAREEEEAVEDRDRRAGLYGPEYPGEQF